jgi:hypothetical protein
MKMKGNKRDLVKKYGKDAEAVMYGRATNMAKKQTKEMRDPKLTELIKDALKNPKKADLNKDGKLSDYEETRGAAIEKNIEENVNPELDRFVNRFVEKLADRYDYSLQDAVNAIMGVLRKQNYDGINEENIGLANPEEKDFTYDYEDIGQFYLEGFNRPHSLNNSELEILGKRVVDQLYKGDIGAAYDDIVFKKRGKERMNESNSNYPDFDLNKNIKYQSTSISSGMWRYTGTEQGGKGVYKNLNNGQILGFDRSDFDVFRKNLSSHFDFITEISEDLDLGHEDNEPDMIKGDLYQIGKASMKLYKVLDQFDDMGEVDLPSWWQSKIFKAKEAVVGAQEYLEFELNEPRIDTVVDAATDVVSGDNVEVIDDIDVNETVEDYITSVDDLNEKKHMKNKDLEELLTKAIKEGLPKGFWDKKIDAKDEDQDGKVDESYDNLVSKIKKQGKSDKAAKAIAGAVASYKAKGGGKGPTAKQK